MRDFPSCFGEHGVQVSDSSTRTNKTAQNLVTCIYQAQILGRPHTINMTWSKTLMGQGLSMGIDGFSNQCLCKVEIKPWLFSKRKGSKSLVVENNKIHVFWDLSAAKFGPGPEPLEGFFVAVVSDLKMVLLLGDLTKESYRRTNARPPPSNAALIARKEHIHGKKVYSTKARFCDNGHSHDVAIECDTVGLNEPCLEIHINKKRVLQIKRLSWKFRGNQTILVDGLPVEVFWDVHSWLFGPPTGNAVFMFQTCLSGLEQRRATNKALEANTVFVPEEEELKWSRCSQKEGPKARRPPQARSSRRDCYSTGGKTDDILIAWRKDFLKCALISTG
ncbi:hypothetical protein OPV22_027198 [Ensete ventricosum]|uniref:DUF868 domain-containing protein n=1 Tax=Ensete ventricosum TaxID=4639 RepID=A0AAV8Q546_ENSVE|nr:hypothetical protein OPV22_027198 [Ensete ventricosum]